MDREFFLHTLQAIAQNKTEDNNPEIVVFECMDGRVGLSRACGFKPGELFVVKTPGGVIENISAIKTAKALGAKLCVFSYHTSCAAHDENDSLAQKTALAQTDVFNRHALKHEVSAKAVTVGYNVDTGEMVFGSDALLSAEQRTLFASIQEGYKREKEKGRLPFAPKEHTESAIFFGVTVSQYAPYFDGKAFGIFPLKGKRSEFLAKAAAIIDNNLKAGRVTPPILLFSEYRDLFPKEFYSGAIPPFEIVNVSTTTSS